MALHSEPSHSTLADKLLDAGKRAFDPSSDPGAREDALSQFRGLIDGYA